MRFGCSVAVAALLLTVGTRGLHDAVANGDTRMLTFSHTHRDDQITVTFKRNGRYDDDGLKQLNHFLRDWRTNDETRMDPRLFDILWEITRETGAKGPIRIVSSYRAPATNAMLHRRSSGVARHSLHMQGMAIDFYIADVPLEELRKAGLRLQRGGVGFYPTSGSPFVHVDVGNVRHWPRMTREQLAKVFPDGRTVHVPTDGRPMSGYALALADIGRRGGSPSGPSLQAAQHAGVMTADASGASSSNFFKRILGIGKDDEDETAAAPAAPVRAKPVPTTVAALDKGKTTTVAVPLPTARPAFTLAAATTPAPAPKPVPEAPAVAPAAATTTTASLTPVQIINLRGYFHGMPSVDAADLRQLKVASAPRPQRAAAPKPAPARAPTDVQITASLTPWPQTDRVPPEVALGYAAQTGADSVSRAEPMGATLPRLASAPGTPDTTIAVKRGGAGRTGTVTTPPRRAQTAKVGDRLNLPWLRALIVTPNTRMFLTTNSLGLPDYQYLAALMRKPDQSVVMGFGVDPQGGLRTDTFTGDAVVFQTTVSFTRTAALR